MNIKSYLNFIAIASLFAAMPAAAALDLTIGTHASEFGNQVETRFSDDQNNQTGSTTQNQGYATGRPTISILGVSRIGAGMADVTVSYDIGTAHYSHGKEPLFYVEYVNTATNEKSATNYYHETGQSHDVTFTLYGLARGANYEYRAVMNYAGRVYKTDYKSFTTTGTVVSSTPVPNPTPTQSTYTGFTIWSLLGLGKSSGSTAPAKTKESAVYTAGSNHANGVAIGITDAQARVSHGDTIEFTVQYQNTRTTSLMNTELAIVLPEEYEFIRSLSDFDYDESTNTISLPIGRIASGGTVKSVSFTARAIGDVDHDVKTTATLFYEGGQISASDRDAFHGGSKSVLGASVFGTEFFPQTFVGWLLIIILITILIIAARRYTKPAPTVQVEPKTA